MLHKQIKEELKEAIINKESVKKDTIRQILSESTNELVAKKMKPTEFLEDGDILKVIKKLVKQRKESIESYEKAGYKDNVKQETEEKEILESYLPEEMSDEDIEKIIKDVLDNMDNKENMGLVMKEVMKKIGDNANGSKVSQKVKELLN